MQRKPQLVFGKTNLELVYHSTEPAEEKGGSSNIFLSTLIRHCVTLDLAFHLPRFLIDTSASLCFLCLVIRLDFNAVAIIMYSTCFRLLPAHLLSYHMTAAITEKAIAEVLKLY
jgi:hypothetical protein